MTIKRLRVVALVGTVLVAGALAGRPASAEDTLSGKGWSLADGASAPARADSLLDSLPGNLRLGPLGKSDDSTLRLSLPAEGWGFFKDVRPYAALNPSVVRPLTDTRPAMAAPSREVASDPWKGLGVGAGVQWRLSDRLDLFGQYQFLNLPGASSSTSSPFLRRDVETPGMRGGFSIHF
jgi:hypothetical protein